MSVANFGRLQEPFRRRKWCLRDFADTQEGCEIISQHRAIFTGPPWGSKLPSRGINRALSEGETPYCTKMLQNHFATKEWFRSRATFCLQLGVIRVSAMEDPDMADWGSWNASFPIQLLNSGCDTSGWKWRQPDGIPTRMEFLPGWNSYPDGNELDVVVLRRPPHFSSNLYTVWSVRFLTA